MNCHVKILSLRKIWASKLTKTKKGEPMAKSSKTDKFNHLLGCVPDKDIAKLSGLKTPAAVQSRRKQLNIPSFRASVKKIRESDAGWKRSKDEDAAKKLGVPELLLSVFRYIDALKKDQKDTTEKYKLDSVIVDAVMNVVGEKKKPATKKTTKSRKTSRRKTVRKPVEQKKEKKEKKEKEPTKSTKTAFGRKPRKPGRPAKKTTKKVTAKRAGAKPKVELSRLFQCVFSEGDTTTSVYVVASSFQEASKKVEDVQGVLFASSTLKTIQNIGQAIP